jgi:hypothetical protein
MQRARSCGDRPLRSRQRPIFASLERSAVFCATATVERRFAVCESVFAVCAFVDALCVVIVWMPNAMLAAITVTAARFGIVANRRSPAILSRIRDRRRSPDRWRSATR